MYWATELNPLHEIMSMETDRPEEKWNILDHRITKSHCSLEEQVAVDRRKHLSSLVKTQWHV